MEPNPWEIVLSKTQSGENGFEGKTNDFEALLQILSRKLIEFEIPEYHTKIQTLK